MYFVILPLTLKPNQRYDLIVDDGQSLQRAQCKTGRLLKGCVAFKTASVNGFTGTRRTYRGEIDIFLVYCPDNDKIYRVPINATGESATQLRVEPLRSGAPRSTVKWARDFELR